MKKIKKIEGTTITTFNSREEVLFDAGIAVGLRWMIDNYSKVMISEKFGKKVKLSKLIDEAKKWSSKPII